MKFSIFFEMQIADPTAAKEAQTFHDCAEQSVLADELGYHCVWEVEHHGLYEYSHSSAPEVFLSFVAGRTRRIRLGHGVTLLPFRYNHPIRIAERVATLDILSGGRVNWGSGKSSSLVEQVAFENEIPKLHEQWLEAVEMIPRMWAADVFEHKGKFFQIAPTQIVPKPVQKPHPPMFAACSNPDSAAYVGRLGLGALNFAFGSPSASSPCRATSSPKPSSKRPWPSETPPARPSRSSSATRRARARPSSAFATSAWTSSFWSCRWAPCPTSS